MTDQPTNPEDPWFKVITLINRALLLTEGNTNAAVVNYLLAMAKQEAETQQEAGSAMLPRPEDTPTLLN
ncbi:hypothetical protein SAMN04515647_3738 [Cohaesibacter sp. ES.047]|uniref:hypothetical protein n=1 Tax=Cohaesibacter sp. ES.047 TaxID=1798205 RepID=UPI000BB72705|nr:hypothetical protein [Cohaesibacter sp. ES.047]SNY93443.1 hypothetical protein SAMN04515647_3738 [Cohaesibacter sp. ES.047]